MFDSGRSYFLGRSHIRLAPIILMSLTKEAGHRVLRLPPYHCQYNPIELIWAHHKGNVAKKNNFKMEDLKNLVRESLSLITPQNWLEAVQDEDGKRDIAAKKFIEAFVKYIFEDSEEIDE